jgi:hypothetical protein
MVSRLIAQSLMSIVPEKLPATLTLLPDSVSPVTVNVFNAWLKPMDVKNSVYGNLNLQGDETRINIPQNELNPFNNGREIRARDQIVIGGLTYIVLAATLRSVRTRWECVVRKVLN